MQDATENCLYPELVGDPPRLELNFIFPLEQVTELIVLGERMSSIAVHMFVVVGKKYKIENASLQKKLNRILLLKYR